MNLDKLNLTSQEKELVKLLLSKEMIQEIEQKLLGNSVHELVQKPRLHFQSTPKSRRKIKATIVKNEDYDEDDFDDEELGEDETDFHSIFPKPLNKYFRRDTFLTGGAVAAIIFEKLTGTKAVINDVDLFFYHYSAKDQSNAEQERYNNLSGEERAYHIRKVKEVGILNLIQINLEDDFSWWSVLDSFDLNYSQVGINLSENQIYFTKNFIQFLTKKVIELVPEFDKEFPITSYLRGVHKAQDFQVPFYARDLVQKYIAHGLGHIVFGDKETVLSVRTNEEGSDGDEFVTEKRLQHWLKHPDILPFMTPEVIASVTTSAPEEIKQGKKNKPKIEHQIRIQLPDEPWVGVVETIYQVYNRQNQNDIGSTAMLSQLEKHIPNFYNLRPTVALRLKQFMQSKIFSTRVSYHKERTDLVSALVDYPELLSKDISIKKLIQIEPFLHSHQNFLQSVNYRLLQKGSSVDEILDFLAGLNKFDLALIGILETALNEENPVQRHGLDRDDLSDLLISKNHVALKEKLEAIYKRRLEKNRVVPEEQKLKIKPFARWVTELIQNDQLVIEGKNMNHCVGGYGEKVKRNESRIFHIQVGKNSSTLEVGIYIQKIVAKQKLQVERPSELKQVALSQSVDPNQKNLKNEYLFEVVNRRNSESKVYTKISLDPNKNYFTDKYTISFKTIQHRAKHNSNPHKTNKKVEELLLRYLNSEVSRNQGWMKKIVKGHVTRDNSVSRWPYLTLEE